MVLTVSNIDIKASNQCVFLLLPQELRDTIYEYALTSEEGVLVKPLRCEEHEKETWEARHLDNGGPHNQLRFVCHQIRKEVWGLGLKFNNLVFHSTPKEYGLEILNKFLTAYPQELQSRIKHITVLEMHRVNVERAWCMRLRLLPIFEHPPPNIYLLNPATMIQKFCNQNPNNIILIRYNCNFSQSVMPWATIIWTSVYARALRGTYAFPHMNTYHWAVEKRVEELGNIDSFDALMPNFRFSLSTSFDEEGLREMREIPPPEGRPTNEEFEDIVTAARRLFDEGF